MKIVTILVLTLASSLTLASQLTITCGDDNSVVTVIATKETLFSTPVVKAVVVDGRSSNFAKVQMRDSTLSVSGFGYKGYESIAIQLDLSKCGDGNSIVGQATYDYYNAKVPYNPMYKKSLACACKAD